jgi:Na+(H+)/acetate symporter ActP
MATAADWMSAASFISMAGIISFDGYDGAVYLMGWTGGYVLLALYAPYLRKFGNLPFQILLENVITLTPQERLLLSVH